MQDASHRKWHNDLRPQDVRVGKHFVLSDLLYSEEAIQKGIANCPVDYNGVEVQGIKGLCAAILDPVVDQFGPLSVTFAYCSPELWQHWYGSEGSANDLHTFRSCRGIGGAADILVHSHPVNPRPVFNWIRQNCASFDRLILYPNSPIICTAWVSENPRHEAREWVFPADGSKAKYLKAGWLEPHPKKVQQLKTQQMELFKD